jgi:hypothetical protein
MPSRVTRNMLVTVAHTLLKHDPDGTRLIGDSAEEPAGGFAWVRGHRVGGTGWSVQ